LCQRCSVTNVSIHAPGKGATTAARQEPVRRRFQSTPPGRGRHKDNGGNDFADCVSIHAPGKGATLDEVRVEDSYGVSIHAPGKGATAMEVFGFAQFNVSIHAPGKGATQADLLVIALLRVSIHAPGKGATHNPRLLDPPD